MHTPYYTRSARSCFVCGACYWPRIRAISSDGFNRRAVSNAQYPSWRISELNSIILLAKPPLLWYTTCRIYLSHLLEHVADLAARLDCGAQDAESVFSLRYSIIFSLTTLAQICHTLARGRPTAAALREQRNNALRRVLLHVRELRSYEFRLLDPFISVSDIFIHVTSHTNNDIIQIYWSHTLMLFAQEIPSPISTLQDPNVSEGVLCVSICFGTLWPTMPESIPPRELDFETNVLRLAALNEEYMNSRWLPGTTTLCATLAAENLRRASESPLEDEAIHVGSL